MSGQTTRVAWWATVPRACAVAARRPASWIAAAVGIALPAWAASSHALPAPWLLVAVLACLAAVGDVPVGLLRPGDRADGGEIVFWTAVRGLWPAAGLCLGAVAAGRGAVLPAAVAGAALLTAAATAAVGRIRGAKAADAAALVIALAGLAAAVSTVAPGSAAARAGMAGLAWLAIGGLAGAWWLAHRGGGPLPMLESPMRHRDGELTPVDPLPSSGLLRVWLGRVAMLTALVGMAAWLVPPPSLTAPAAAVSPWGAALARIQPWATATAGWFLALAVPQAILQDGVAGTAAWSRLMRTVTAPRGRPRPGAFRFAAGVLLTHAAVLGWPPLVAAVLSLPSGAASLPPLAILAGLLVGAGGVAALVAGGTRLALSRETQFALLLAVASLLVMLVWGCCGALPSPTPPRLPILGGQGPCPARRGRLGGFRVEQTAVACENPRLVSRSTVREHDRDSMPGRVVRVTTVLPAKAGRLSSDGPSRQRSASTI